MAEASSSVVFPTKIDRWLVVVLFLALASMLASLSMGVNAAQNWAQALGAAIPPLIVITIVALLSYPTRYLLEGAELVVQSGRIRYRMPYAEIRAVTPSRSVMSAPAWSLDRLKVEGENRSVLISPREKDAFLRALLERAPQLTRSGDALVRRG